MANLLQKVGPGSVVADNPNDVKLKLPNAKSEHLNPDGTFKGGFEGCVAYMQEEGHSKESAHKICGSIAKGKLGQRFGPQDVKDMDERFRPVLINRALMKDVYLLRAQAAKMGNAQHAHFFTHCIEDIVPKMKTEPTDPNAFCAWLEHQVTGTWPAEKRRNPRGQALAVAEPNLRVLAQRGTPQALTNRDNFELPADGWYHVLPKGDFEWTGPDGTTVVQVIDDKACKSIVNRFNADKTAANFPGLLIDYDHFSLDDSQKSEAAGWALELQNRADGVWAKPKWSDVGEAAVKGGRYRLVSPVWLRKDCENLENGRIRPLRLDSIALTNDPNLKGLTPLSNRAPAWAGDATKGNMDHKKKLTDLLGLKEDASDEEIHQAHEGAMAQKTQAAKDAEEAAESEAEKKAESEGLKNRVAELEKEAVTLRGEAVERDLIEFAAVITDKEAVKKQLLANRDGSIAILRGLKKPVTGSTAPIVKPLYNRATAGLPKLDLTTGGDTTTEAQASAIMNRASELEKTLNVTWRRAWDMAKAELVKA